VYVDSDLFVRGRSDNLNFSEIMNLALAAIYGTDYGEDRKIIRNRIPMMQKTISEKVNEEKEAIRTEQERIKAEQKEHERIETAIMSSLEGIRSLAYGRLPEFDIHGDYESFWARLAEKASQAAGVEISPGQVQCVVRQGYAK